MDDTTLSAVCELFDLGAPIGAPTAVSGGLTNRLWRVTTTNGVFAVKQMNRDPDRADYVAWFDRAFTLEQAAFRAGIPMPRPVPVASTGGCLGELQLADTGAITVRAHEWVEGEPLSNGEIYPAEVAARVAVILANIHALGLHGRCRCHRSATRFRQRTLARACGTRARRRRRLGSGAPAPIAGARRARSVRQSGAR